MKIKNKVYKWTNKHKLWSSSRDKLGITVSGGPDSVFLLDILYRLRNEIGKELFMIHLNHELRGEEADRDENFVNSLAQKYELDFFSKSIDVKELSEQEDLSLEMAARKARYNYFQKISQENNSDVCTGHTQDDNIETVIFNIIRGTGLKGLSGIPIKRDYIIRPILFLEKKKILDYLHKRNLEYKVDQSNKDVSFTRNKIRHQLLPYLEKKFNPKVREHIHHMSKIIKEENSFLQSKIDEFLNKYEVLKLENIYAFENAIFDVEVAIMGEILRAIIDYFDIELRGFNFKKVSDFYESYKNSNVGAEFEWGKGANKLRAEKRGDEVIFYIPQQKESVYRKVKPQDDNKGDYQFKLQKELDEKDFPPQNNLTAFCNYNRDDDLKLAIPEEGESIVPLGMHKEKRISRIYIDNKVPRFLRRGLKVLYINKEVAWIPGLKISERYKVTQNSNLILKAQLTGNSAEIVRRLVYGT